jgi:septal ring factor EnvC (AmiA/AmiB activator)
LRRAPLLSFLSACLFCSIAVAAPQTKNGVVGGSLAERYSRAQAALQEQRANEEKTRAERDRLAAEAKDLQARLIANAAKVQELKGSYADTEAQLASLNGKMRALETDLARDRNRVTHLLAVLQRLQAEQPPALVVRPDDSLAAVRGTIQMGAMLPPVYAQAAELAKRLQALADARKAVATKAALGRSQAEALKTARASLDRLLAQKGVEQTAVEARLSELHEVAEEIGRQADDLKALIDRVAALRQGGVGGTGMTVVNPEKARPATLARGSLRLPVVGTALPGDPSGPGSTPGANGPSGLWFETSGKAAAIAPGDSVVVFAGTYQKFGQVLILELGGGYHLTLAGLGRIDVHIGDTVLAGEPVGILPEGRVAQLYMELRHNGQAVDPAPWMSADFRKVKGT